jgi:hypothetical protein
MRFFILFILVLVAATGCTDGGSRYVGTWRGASGCMLFFGDRTGVIYRTRSGGGGAESQKFSWAPVSGGSVSLAVGQGKAACAVPISGEDGVLCLDGERFEKTP